MSSPKIANSPIFNPRPRVERVALPNGRFCLVIDDALSEPERVVAFAVAQAAAFRNVDFNAYPGTYLMAPADMNVALEDFFVQHLRRFFDARRVVSMHCRFSMVTLQPEELRPYQWFCHRDNVAIAPTQTIQASVLYLFKDGQLGGTSFYEPALSAAELDRFNYDAGALGAAAFADKYAIAQAYLCASNRYFTQIGSIPALFNRLIFYDGSILHSGDIAAPEKLSADPARGRLTFNGFFVSRRRAA